MTEATRRVRRTAVSNDGAASHRAADFACAYEVDIAPGDERPAEQWAREAWEGASAPLRWFMLAGWRIVLGLRLGPRSSPDHILGWTITDRSPDQTACELTSPFLSASNIFRRVDGRLVWSTFVTYDRPIARIIWPPASLLHRPLVRVALGRAARHPGERVIRGPIYHLAVIGDWESDPSGPYTTSTLGKSLEEQGFMHCSFREQVQQIADRVYRGREDVVLLEIDPARLVAPIRVENLDGGDESFPHIYGPLDRDAVVRVTALRVLADGRLDVAEAL